MCLLSSPTKNSTNQINSTVRTSRPSPFFVVTTAMKRAEKEALITALFNEDGFAPTIEFKPKVNATWVDYSTTTYNSQVYLRFMDYKTSFKGWKLFVKLVPNFDYQEVFTASRKQTFREFHIEDDLETQLAANIVTVDSPNFEEALDQFAQCREFGYDLETYGNPFQVVGKSGKADGLNPFRGRIRLVQVSFKVGDTTRAIVIDLGGWTSAAFVSNHCLVGNRTTEFFNLSALPLAVQKFFRVLKEKLWCKKTRTVGHNLKFDLGYTMTHFGFYARNCIDTMLASQILWSGIGVDKALPGQDRGERSRLRHSLAAVVKRLRLGELDKSEQLSDWGIPQLTNAQINYAAKDALIVLEAWSAMKPQIRDAGLTFSLQAEFLALPVFAEMEVFGYPINLEKTEVAIAQYEAAQSVVIAPFNELFPDVQWTENEKVIAAVETKLGLKLVDGKGKPTCDVKVLKALKQPWADAIVKARNLNISLQYLRGLRDKAFINQFGHSVIVSNFFQIREGWRSSSRNPNLQNTPKLTDDLKALGLPSVRSVFEAPEGFNLIVQDLSGAHARICTQASKDKTLVAVYNENKDNHVLTARALLEVEGRYFTEEQALTLYKSYKKKIKDGLEPTEDEQLIATKRQEGKTGFYSFLNQAGAATMQQSFAKWGVQTTKEACQNLITALRKVYVDLYAYIKRQMVIANSYNLQFDFEDKNGNSIKNEVYGVITSITGGRKFCKKEISFGKFQVAYTDSISFMWLSAEASMIKTAMGLIREQLLELTDRNTRGIAYTCGFLHDEADGLVSSDLAEQVAVIYGSTIAEVLRRFITVIPVEESSDYAKAVCKTWAEK